MTFIGASPNAEIRGLDRLRPYANLGNNDPPGFQTTPLGGDPYTASGGVSAILEWPGLDQPAEMDAFVLRFEAP